MKITKTQLRQLVKEQVETFKEARKKENREGYNLDKEERFQEKLANDPKFKAKYEAEKDPWKKQAMKNKLKEQVINLDDGWMENLSSVLKKLPPKFIKPLAIEIYSNSGQTEHQIFYQTLDRVLGKNKSDALQATLAKKLFNSNDPDEVWMEISEPIIKSLPDSIVLKLIDNGMGSMGQREVENVYRALERIKKPKKNIREQVGGMVPPSSNVEEAINPRFTGIDNIGQLEAYGIDIETLLVQLDKAANNYFLNSWGDYDEEQIKMMLDDLKIMAYVRKYLQEGKIEKALNIYRKADTMLRDAFPPLMWKLSNNQYEDLKAKGKIKKL